MWFAYDTMLHKNQVQVVQVWVNAKKNLAFLQEIQIQQMSIL